jgi:mono/diheme cytochrome c family protein
VRRRRGIPALALLLVVGAAACEKHEFEPPDRDAQVEEASRRYSQALFDTVTWASDSARAFEGNALYAASCRRCHGTLGRGDTELAAERGLEVPSLVEPDWPYAVSVDTVRHRIFAGHPEGMPTFGVARLSPREIDGVAWYILEELRPEVLGREGG